MNPGVATARVWLAVTGVVGGTLVAQARPSPIACVAAAACGAALLLARRRPVLAGVGIVVVAGGLVAMRPPEPLAFGPRVPPRTVFGDSTKDSFRSASADAGALLSGLTIGDTSGIDDRTLELFRRSGLAHLVAVSGSNVAIVLGAVAVVTAPLPLVARAAIALAVLAGYVMVVGAEPSVLRAAAMGAVTVVAVLAGTRALPLNSLGIAIIAVIAFAPGLLFAVGFHLSVAATLGIVLWAPLLERRLRRLASTLRIPVAITLAAQIAVAPVIAGTFERLSVVAPIANVLAAPAVAPATLLGLAAGLAGLVAPDLGRLLGMMAAPFASWILFVARETGAWDWSSVTVDPRFAWISGVPIGLAAVAAAVRGAGR